MYDITLDRSWYSRTAEVYNWLEKYLGPSKHTSSKGIWDIKQNFGLTFINFDSYDDYIMFKEKFK